MKNVLFLFALITCLVSIAEVKQLQGYGNNSVFYQFTHIEPENKGDYRDGKNNGQNWLAAQTIKLTVGSECDVWLSNYVSTWYGGIPELNGNVFQMGDGQYGAWQLNGDKTWVGNGETALVTYKDSASGAENTTSAYLLGHFDGGEEIALWMTTLENEGGEQVDTMQYVYDAEHATTLYSRVDGTHDLADNVRINFGLTTVWAGREFVAFGVDDGEDKHYQPSGQPLPGLPITCALMFGTIACAKRMKSRFLKKKYC